MSEYMTDRYPYLVWQPKEYCENCDSRLWKQTLIRKTNDFRVTYKCPLCKAVIRTEELKPKIERIEAKPILLDFKPILKNYEETTPHTNFYIKKYTLKSGMNTGSDEDSILFNLIKIIVYLIVDLFLLGLLLKLIT